MKYIPSDININNVDIGHRDFYVNMTGNNFSHGFQSVGTGTEAVSVLADVSTQGFVFVRNLDNTNYVLFGAAATGDPVKCKAKEAALFRINGTLYGKANTAACNVEYYVFED